MDLHVSDEKKSLLWKMVEHSEKNLCESEREKLFTVLHLYADIFSSDKLDFGHTTITQHRIDTGHSPPIRQHMRRTPAVQKEAARQLVQDMLVGGSSNTGEEGWLFQILHRLPQVE